MVECQRPTLLVYGYLLYLIYLKFSGAAAEKLLAMMLAENYLTLNGKIFSKFADKLDINANLLCD